MPYERELAVAKRLATDAGVIALQYSAAGVQAEDKPDDSPVTIADKECEKFFVAELLREFPDDGLLGEEGANRQSGNGRKWIIDPIDGTRDFVRRNRVWANLVALEVNGVVEVGVATFPALNEQYWAVRGGGAWKNGPDGKQRLQCSSITSVDKAVISFNQLGKAAKWPHADRILPFISKFWTIRAFGGALDAALVSAGSMDLWIEHNVKPWDLAPLSVIVKEAGCRYFDFKGEDTIYGGTAVICVPALEQAAKEFLGI